ncbi:MAG: nitrous oxide-stimulated promoter family protein, partial [Muribaculaceae bacterium]
MTRIEQEKETVRQMVEIYCRGKKHTSKGLCQECST